MSIGAAVGPGAGVYLPRGITTIAERLHDAGYTTAAIHSNPYPSRLFGYQRGFDHFDDALRVAVSGPLAIHLQRAINYMTTRPYRAAASVNTLALRWLDSDLLPRPFFLWLHYMDAHGPYVPSRADMRDDREGLVGPSGRSRAALWRRAKWSPQSVTTEERTVLRDLYDAEVRGLDREIGGLVHALGDRGLIENTGLVITSDHGEAFGEHGKFDHPNELYDENLRVPLIVVAPGMAGTIDDTVVSTIDVAATLMDLAALGEGLHPGSSLTHRTPVDDAAVISEVSGEREDAGMQKFCVRTRTHKLVVTYRGGSPTREALYDLVQDPGETHDVREEQFQTRDRLAEILASHLRNHHVGAIDVLPIESADQDPRLRHRVEERLRDLGYLETE